MRFLVFAFIAFFFCFSGCSVQDEVNPEYVSEVKQLTKWRKEAFNLAMKEKDPARQIKMIDNLKDLTLEKHQALAIRFPEHGSAYEQLVSLYDQVDAKESFIQSVESELLAD